MFYLSCWKMHKALQLCFWSEVKWSSLGAIPPSMVCAMMSKEVNFELIQPDVFLKEYRDLSKCPAAKCKRILTYFYSAV